MLIRLPNRRRMWTARRAAVALALLALVSCREGSRRPAAGQAAAAPGGAPPAYGPRRVVLVSLDGAAADTLAALQGEGAFGAGGFARFFAEGEVAGRLVPVNPTLTAPNHVSLATGYAAGVTGIVSGVFHPAGAPWPRTVSGFAAPIAAETLWEAARRQGRAVGVATWPGADGMGERRRADWGLVYATQPERPAEILTLGRQDFHPLAGAVERGEGPALVARAGGYELVVRAARGGRRAAVAEYKRLGIRENGSERLLRPGEWAQLEDDPGPATPAGAAGRTPSQARWAKLLALDPHLASVRLYLGGVYSLRAYPGDFAAALAARGLAWPGPPDDRRLGDRWRGQPGIDLDTWAEQAERFAGFFGETLRAGAARPDWDLLMGYFPSIDEAGHELTLVDPRQPGYSAERRADCERVRRRVWQAVDRELARLLATVDLATTVVAVVSDHGMTPVHTALDPNAPLAERGLLVWGEDGEPDPARTTAVAVGDGGVAHVYLAPGAAGRERLAAELRDLFAGWRVGDEAVIERVVPRAAAGEVGLASPNSGDLILFAREGYGFRDLRREKGAGGRPAAAGVPSSYGTHGYLNSHPDMHGIYLAIGAGIAKRRLESVSATEIAGRVAAWMGIEPPRSTAPPAPAEKGPAPAGR